MITPQIVKRQNFKTRMDYFGSFLAFSLKYQKLLSFYSFKALKMILISQKIKFMENLWLQEYKDNLNIV